MATETVTLHPIDDAESINAQIALVQWIEYARMMIEEISASQRYAPGFGDLLRDRGIRSPRPWDDEESTGLQHLLIDISNRVGDMAAARTEAKHV